MPIIEAKKISRVFTMGDTSFTALKEVDLSVDSGEFVMLTGRSGAGKSTLLYQLSLLDSPTSGEIWIDGANVDGLSSKASTRFRLERLGYIFQEYALMPELTALENVALKMIMLGYSTKESKAWATEILSEVDLADRLTNLPGQLSGGQQQRVSIARAVVNNPKIIFADEPTANLDSKSALAIVNLLKKLNKDGKTIIMVTHEEEYYKYADRVIKMSDGRIIS